ncbi:MAG TPA: choice-of-anchor P family protein, partial [Nevskiaceae bacterium]|nr:choice-of-anchor P family protein [Nevskiaceae bacterium]
LTVSDSRVTEMPSEANAQSTAETAGIRLFNGMITADIVRANVEAIARGDSSAFSDAGSTFQNLAINGVRIETVRPNTRIDLPLLGQGAHVTLFETIGTTSAPPPGQLSGGTYAADVTVNMIHVVIPALSDRLPPIEIIVSQARAHADFPQTTRCPPAGDASAVSGHSYILSATIDHPMAPAVLVGYASIPASGGAGSQALAEVHIPGLVTLGAAKSTSNGTIGADTTKATSRATVAGVDLLDGRITATLVQTQSHSRANEGAEPFSNAKGTQLLNISIMGQTIPDNPPPNMRYEMPGLGYVVFNEQIPDGPAEGHSGLTVRMIHLHADRLLGVLPGGDIIIAESHSDVTR